MGIQNEFDLIICGGGLAGLALAREIALKGPELSVLVLDALERPLPEAAFKVGESTVETAAYYLARVLDLESHLDAEHVEKLGLRYFFASECGHIDLSSRPEYGTARFLPVKAYQLDRGKLENHLRELVKNTGMTLIEGAQVSGITLNPDNPHLVTWRDKDGAKQATARWVVDAMGRRRYLQQRMDLGKASMGAFNSVWFRAKAKINASDLVPRSNTAWHSRVDFDRWQSTNHFMGSGYWVWLIPLAPDVTSVGIVAMDELHPFESYSTWDKACAWLEQHEPLIARSIRGVTVLDFRRLKNYSYSSKQVFSIDRWACTGEAAVFADPYYSVGTNVIGYQNGLIRRMLELDRAGELTREYVDYANSFVLSLNDALTDTIHRTYRFHHCGPVMALKTIWDYYIGWTTADPQFYYQTYLDAKLTRAISGIVSPATITRSRMISLFEDWGARGSRYTFDFIDYVADQPTLKDLHVRLLPEQQRNLASLLQTLRESAQRIEEVAHVMFFLAVQDVLPEFAGRFESLPWINTAAISLDPSRWEQEGLFQPKSKPRPLASIYNEFSRLFRFSESNREEVTCAVAP